MPVIEVTAGLAQSGADPVATTLAVRGDTRWVIRQERDSGRTWLTGYFSSRTKARVAWSQLAAAIDRAWLTDRPALRVLVDRDWKDSYRAHFKPWHLGRMHWAPIWKRRRYRVPRRAVVVWLDPGMAFGTGDHPTTRLCCERLVAFAALEGARQAADRRIWDAIDAGCGSGILAISAARLGARSVFGFDCDPAAVRVSRVNSALNGVSEQMTFSTAGLRTGLKGRRARLVLANIQADVLIRHRRELAAAVFPGGWLALSGILARELPQVRAAFAFVGPTWKTASRRMGEWADLLLIRPANPARSK